MGEWFDKLVDWFGRQLSELWDAFSRFMSDLFWMWLEHWFGLVLFLLSKIPGIGDSFDPAAIQNALVSAGPTVMWLAGVLQVGPGLGLIGVGIVFYFVRRIITIGIW